MTEPEQQTGALAVLTVAQREQAMAWVAVLRPHLEEGVTLAKGNDRQGAAAHLAAVAGLLPGSRAGGLGLPCTVRPGPAGCLAAVISATELLAPPQRSH